MAAHRPALIFIFVTAVLDIMAMGIIIPVLPALIEEFVGSNAQAGFWNGALVALWAAMQFIFSPIIGSLSDHYGRWNWYSGICSSRRRRRLPSHASFR